MPKRLRTNDADVGASNDRRPAVGNLGHQPEPTPLRGRNRPPRDWQPVIIGPETLPGRHSQARVTLL